MKRLAAAVFALVLFTPALAEGPFTHASDIDRFGYYFLETAPMTGVYQLDYVHVGFDFDAWEKGERLDTYAPVMVEFSDTTSEKGQNELGQEYYQTTIRVLPTSYNASNDAVTFEGEDPLIGKVTLKATFNGPGEMVGDISYGDQVLTGQAFTYFAGD